MLSLSASVAACCMFGCSFAPS